VRINIENLGLGIIISLM